MKTGNKGLILLIKGRIFLVLMLFFIGTSYSQNRKELDSLSKLAVRDVYNNPKESIRIASKLYALAKANPKLRISSLMTLAQANVMLTDYEKAIEQADEALSIATGNNDYPNQILVNNFLGNHYLRINLQEKAWEKLRIAEKLITKHPVPDSLIHLVGNVYLLKGYLYADKVDCNYAIIYFNKAIKAFEKSRNKEFSKINIGVIYTHKGRCQLQNNALDSAEYCFQKAISISSENANNGVTVFSKLSLAQVYAKKNLFVKSNQLLLDANKLATESAQMELTKEIYKQLSENYLALNDIQNHDKFNKLYNSTLKDFEQTESQSVAKIAGSSSNDYTSETENDTTIFWISSALLALLIVVAILYFAVFKIRKKLKNHSENNSAAKNQNVS